MTKQSWPHAAQTCQCSDMSPAVDLLEVCRYFVLPFPSRAAAPGKKKTRRQRRRVVSRNITYRKSALPKNVEKGAFPRLNRHPLRLNQPLAAHGIRAQRCGFFPVEQHR